MRPNMQEQKAISYHDGLIIKALAVMMMVIHHSFGFAAYYTDAPAYLADTHVYHLAHCFKMCVPIFAFLTGWVYCQHKDKSFAYSAKKIVTLFSDYWVVVLPISLFAFTFCGYNYSGAFLWDLVPACPRSLMIFTWYLWFYVLMMLLFPMFNLLENRRHYVWSVPLFTALLLGVMWCARELPLLHDVWLWYPSAVSGYVVAKLRLFEFCLRVLKPGLLSIAASLLPLAASLYIYRYHSSLLDMNAGYLSVPLFILAVLWCSPLYRIKTAQNVLQFIGKHSMNIWFFHCLFFGEGTRAFVQKAVFISDNPLWIFGSVFLISLVLSILITPVQQRVKQVLLTPLWAKLGW